MKIVLIVTLILLAIGMLALIRIIWDSAGSFKDIKFEHTPPPPGVDFEEEDYYVLSHAVNEHYDRNFKEFSTIGTLTDYTKKRLLAGGKILSIDIHGNFLTFKLKPNGRNK